jgi:hypothetical protein
MVGKLQLLYPPWHRAFGTWNKTGCKGPTTELSAEAMTEISPFSSSLVNGLPFTVTEIHSSGLNVSEKIQHSNAHRIKLYYNFNYPPQVGTEATMDTSINAIRIGSEKLHTA